MGMKSEARRSLAGRCRRIGVALACLLGAQALPATAAAPGDCAALRTLDIPNVEIRIAKVVEGSYTEDVSVGRPMRTYDNLPAFCRVYGFARPVPESRIGFEVWMPMKGWTGRLHMIGGGAYVSNISYEEMIPRLTDGEVAVGTDTGHSGTDLIFGWNHRDRIIDFGYRAVHESVVAAKAVTAAFYGEPAKWSYFSGCSTGGYQGLSEAQRYPDDFDGIISCAPGNNRTNLTLAFLWNYLANHRPGDDSRQILSNDDLRFLNRRVVAACDTIDGVADGVIAYPPACRFDIATLACRGEAKAGTCLTQEQIDAARKIYAGPKHARTGEQLYPGYPFGSEGVVPDAHATRPGWSGYWSETANPGEPSRADMFRYWVFNDPKWNWWTFDWAADVDAMHRRLAPIFDAVDPNLERFATSGGKMMMVMGWLDPVGSPIEAINYYEQVEALGRGETVAERRADTQHFLRLYMVPGMGHSAEGPGATHFSSSTRDSVPPVSDATHDVKAALYAWVEKGEAPGALIATRYVDDGVDHAPGTAPIAFQRPVCVYPERPVYRGGPTEKASSFACENPPHD